jgi:hypothetical protein
MHSMRMVAAAFAALSAMAAAQQPQPIHLIIEATDQAGNAVTGAYIGAEPSAAGAQKSVESRTDGKGEAEFDLVPGTYTLVSMDGCSMMWTQQIDLAGPFDVDVAVSAILKPGTIIDCVEVTMAATDMQLLPASSYAAIPLREIKLLPLKARHRRRR